MSPAVVVDTGGLLRAIARTSSGEPSFPEYETVLTSARVVIVPGLVLAEVDYFLRENRVAMRRLVAQIFDPATRYEYELPLPRDIARALELDARFENLGLGLVDGMVAAIAERRQVYRVLTTDRRDFSAIRVGPRLTRALELVP
ncbi:MAG: PIN domain-containing protein [Bryobacteraceae bacterium]